MLSRQQAKLLESNAIWIAFKEGEKIKRRWNASSWATTSKIDPEELLKSPEIYKIQKKKSV